MSGEKVYYYCAVPKCVNTSTKNPEKKFFSSPSDAKRRRTWLKRMRRNPKDLSLKTTFYVCEDHFNVSTGTSEKTMTFDNLACFVQNEMIGSDYRSYVL